MTIQGLIKKIFRANVTMEYYLAGSPPPSSASAILTENQIN
jgi:hypothetical protein